MQISIDRQQKVIFFCTTFYFIYRLTFSSDGSFSPSRRILMLCYCLFLSSFRYQSSYTDKQSWWPCRISPTINTHRTSKQILFSLTSYTIILFLYCRQGRCRNRRVPLRPLLIMRTGPYFLRKTVMESDQHEMMFDKHLIHREQIRQKKKIRKFKRLRHLLTLIDKISHNYNLYLSARMLSDSHLFRIRACGS